MHYDSEKLSAYFEEALIRGEFKVKTRSHRAAVSLRWALYRRRGMRPVQITVEGQFVVLTLNPPNNGEPHAVD